MEIKRPVATGQLEHWMGQVIHEAQRGHPERTSRLVETNVLIGRHNRAVPTPALQIPKLPRDFALTPDKG